MSARTDYVSALFHQWQPGPVRRDVRRVGMSARTDYVSALFHAMAAWPCASVDVKAGGYVCPHGLCKRTFSMQWQPGPVRR